MARRSLPPRLDDADRARPGLTPRLDDAAPASSLTTRLDDAALVLHQATLA